MSFYKEVPGRKTTLESTLKFDTVPTAGSTNPVTSDGVKGAIDGAVGDASAALQEQIDDIAEKAGSGYTPKGEASVATLNGLSGQENGELYTMTDAGTLTLGSLSVVAGDTVAWDDAKSVWYKAMDYAPRQYGTSEIHNLPTTATEADLVSGNYLALDGSAGTKKLSANTIPSCKLIDRGSASVSTINGLSFKQDGWKYFVADSGTLSAGSLEVSAGDSVAWDATNSKWYLIDNDVDYIYKFGSFSLAAANASVTTGLRATLVGATGKYVGENCGFVSKIRVRVNDSSCSVYKCRHSTDGTKFIHSELLVSVSVSVAEVGTIKEISLNAFFGKDEFPAISGGFYWGGTAFYFGKAKRAIVTTTDSADNAIQFNNDDGVAYEVVVVPSIENGFLKDGEGVAKNLSKYNITKQFISQNSGGVNNSSGCDLSDFIPVNEGDVFYYSGFVTSNHNPVWGFTGNQSNNPAYNGATVVLAGSDSEFVNKRFVIPSGVNYIRAWSRNATHSLTPSELKLIKVNPDFDGIVNEPFVRNEIIVDANGNGDYVSLEDAINNAGDDSTHPKVIRVMPGEYTMSALTPSTRASRENRNLAIIGVDKCKCIVRNDVGLYATGVEPDVTEYVDNGCIVLSGKIYIANLTVISTDDNYPAELPDGLKRAYCIHMDGPASSGSIAEVHNCILKNSHSACIGIGLRKNTEVRVTDCICENHVNPALDVYFGSRYFGIIQGHDDGNSTSADEERLILKNNIMINTGTSVAFRWGVQPGATPSTLIAVGNAIKTTDNSDCLVVGNQLVIDGVSSGNNVNGLNA